MPNSRSRRVLMICYYFPPINTAGVARSAGFARHLEEFGWLPTVLTVRKSKDAWVTTGEPIPPDAHVVRAVELNLMGVVNFVHGVVSRLLRLLGVRLKFNYFYDLLCMPDSQIAWLCIPAGVRLARQSDVIYATCSPFSSALVGCFIKAFTGKPLVIDFRDPWVFNAQNNHTRLHFKIIEPLERWVIKHCDRLIVNTPAALRLYQKAYPRHCHKFVAIPNGYDFLPPLPLPCGGELFSIVHVGSFYGNRSPRALLEVLTDLANPNIEFVQIGSDFDGMHAFQGKVRLRALPTMSRHDAIEQMRSASLLYLKQGAPSFGGEAVAVAAKTYEYLASGVPILADVSPGSDADLIREHGVNCWIVTSGSKVEIKAAILQAYARRHSIKPGIDPKYIEQYSRARLTRNLAALLDDAVSSRTASSIEHGPKEYEYA